MVRLNGSTALLGRRELLNAYIFRTLAKCESKWLILAYKHIAGYNPVFNPVLPLETFGVSLGRITCIPPSKDILLVSLTCLDTCKLLDLKWHKPWILN